MWIAEYSKDQKAYHVSMEADTLAHEASAFLERGWVGDWEVIGRFGNADEAHLCCRQHRELT